MKQHQRHPNRIMVINAVQNSILGRGCVLTDHTDNYQSTGTGLTETEHMPLSGKFPVITQMVGRRSEECELSSSHIHWLNSITLHLLRWIQCNCITIHWMRCEENSYWSIFVQRIFHQIMETYKLYLVKDAGKFSFPCEWFRANT